MKKLALLLLGLCFAAGAQAQPVSGPTPIGAAGAYNSVAPTCINGQFCFFQTDANGKLLVTATFTPSGTQNVNLTQVLGAAVSATNPIFVSPATAATPWVVGGNVASGVTDSGNPVKVGGIYNSTLPTLTNGQRGDVQTSVRGEVRSLGTLVQQTGADAQTNSSGGVMTRAGTDNTSAFQQIWPLAFNSSTWDRIRTITGADGTGLGVQAVAVSPTSAAANGITPIVSTATEGSHVLKASAGNLYGIEITTGATPGYLLIFNATSAPADGAVTPIYCKVVPANASIEMSWNNIPAVFATGITAVFSTTGCFTKTISATAFFSGMIK